MNKYFFSLFPCGCFVCYKCFIGSYCICFLVSLGFFYNFFLLLSLFCALFSLSLSLSLTFIIIYESITISITIFINTIIIIIVTTKPRTIISRVNKNQMYSTYPMFIFLYKFSEDTASIFKLTPLTL